MIFSACVVMLSKHKFQLRKKYLGIYKVKVFIFWLELLQIFERAEKQILTISKHMHSHTCTKKYLQISKLTYPIGYTKPIGYSF